VGDVVVLANRTKEDVRLSLILPDGTSKKHAIAEGDVLAVPASGELGLSFDQAGSRRQYRLEVDRIYYFARKDGELEVREVTFSFDEDEGPSERAGENAKDAVNPPPMSGVGVASLFRVGVVPVMILVDDDERATKTVWEARLRRRLKMASEIVRRYGHIGFRVVATGTWDSDDEIRDFQTALREFEVEVIPAPAALAIGFTGQFDPLTKGTNRLGGIRGALRPHLLIREGSKRVSEAERLEVLVHELGHYLGAVHSPDRDSVMRPILADGRARARAFPIRFDAVNTLVMSLVGSEMRSRGITRLDQVRPSVKDKLRTVFAATAKQLQGDGTAEHHIRLLDGTPAIIPPLVADPATLVGATRIVVEGIVEAAEEGPSKSPGGGDDLTDFYFRRAAAAAQTVPDELAPRAYLLGLAVGLDHSTLLRESPLVGSFWRRVESDSERRHRLDVLGSPTMAGRRDLAQHFVVSGGLTALVGPGAAQAVGVAKELADSQRGSGFSFADLTADVAGVIFAQHVCDGRLAFTTLEESFHVPRFMPDPEGATEGLSWQEFTRRYGSTQDDRFTVWMKTARERVLALPGYEPSHGRTRRAHAE
jgi:hypothetical protein